MGYVPNLPPLRPEDFGPGVGGTVGTGNAVVDTAAWAAAVQAASLTKRPIVGTKGTTYRIRYPSTPTYTHPSGISAYVAIPLASNVTIFMEPGAQFANGTQARTFVGGDAMVAFGTTVLNATQGNLTNVNFFDGINDFKGDQYVIPSGVYNYFIWIVGVDHFWRDNWTAQATGTRKGQSLRAENCRWRKETNCFYNNIVQGLFQKYEWWALHDSCSYNIYDEAMDWDGPSWGTTIKSIKAQGGVGEAQLIDCSSGVDWNVSDVQVTGGNSAFFVYFKGLNWPTYQEYLDNYPDITDTCVIPERLSFSRFQLTDCGEFSRETFRVGLERPNDQPPELDGIDPITDCTIEDIVANNCYQATVNECRRLAMNNVKFINGVNSPSGDVETDAAIVLRQSRNADGKAAAELSGYAKNLYVEDAQGQGILCSAADYFTMDNWNVNGYNVANRVTGNRGIAILNLSYKSGFKYIGKMNVTGGQSGNTDFATSDSGDGVDYRASYRGPFNFSTSGGVPVVYTGTLTLSHSVDYLSIRLPDIDTTTATGAASVEINLRAQKGTSLALNFASITCPNAITKNASDYTKFTIQKKAAGTPTTLDSGGAVLNYDSGTGTITAGDDQAFPNINAGALGPATDEQLVLLCERQGNGSKFTQAGGTALIFNYAAIEYGTVGV